MVFELPPGFTDGLLIGRRLGGGAKGTQQKPARDPSGAYLFLPLHDGSFSRSPPRQVSIAGSTLKGQRYSPREYPVIAKLVRARHCRLEFSQRRNPFGDNRIPDTQGAPLTAQGICSTLFQRALGRAYPDVPATPRVRDIHHALALEHGLAGWTLLKARLDEDRRGDASRALTVRALLQAAQDGDPSRVIQLLDKHADIINEGGTLPGHTGLRTALHFGIRHEAVVKCLLERGADPNVRDEGDAALPLHFAAENQDLGIRRLLIEHGADPIGSGDYHELDVIGWATCFDYRTTTQDVVD